ncbi:MAG: cellulose synthase/poly-beta-1,6-N-acetylglucosamine synthase-like glycosyltransferase/peptidoglycan/xylan [Yoonia sp.]|jgi:cellulose synthase/poly-beta-1,6-N-acetylglucosamine synthase-like glycosyltransferase/peptidoglycan/xylan/chitin deacetylase (PgdA/CDA1 family)
MFGHHKCREPEDDVAASQLPVFSDPMRIRSRRIKLIAGVTFVTILLWVVTVGLHIFRVEPVDFVVPPSTDQPFESLFLANAVAPHFHDPLLDGSYPSFSTMRPQVAVGDCQGLRGRQDAFTQGKRDIYVFLPASPVWSHVSLEANCAQVDVLVPAWYEISGAENGVVNVNFQYGDQISALIGTNRNNFALMPSVSLPMEINENDVQKLVGVADRRQAIADELRDIAVSNDLDGICIDTNGFPASTIEHAIDLIQRLAAALDEVKLNTCSIMSFESESWMNETLVTASDQVVVTMIREPFTGSFPAPIAPHQWFVETAAFVASSVPSEKLVFALGTGGYDWESGEDEPVWTDYTSIMTQTALNDGQLRYFDIDLNSQVTYIDDAQNRHVSWFLDAASFHNQMRELENFGLAGVAVWTVGREDPGIWDVLALQGETFATQIDQLGIVSVANDVRHFGEGTFYHLSSETVVGRRSFSDSSGDGLIHTQDYAVLPRPILIERFGESQGHQIALTFDDGPDAVFTEQILDVLQDKGVKATFFIVGQNVALSPEVLQRIVQDGHVIGSHSFFHPHLEDVSVSRVNLELNSLQRIVAGLTGHRMVLYRTPFGNSQGPLTAHEVQPIRIATSLGYVEMGSDIIAYDWTSITADQITEHALQGAHEGGTVVMLHDSGGDRIATVEALGPMIDQLRAEGYKFVSAPEILGLDLADLMPLDDSFNTRLAGLTFNFAFLAANAFVVIFWMTVGLGLLRSITILMLALFRRRAASAETGYEPGVTVVIAAYNEATVIEESIQTILASDYKKLRVLVIDDGSSDGTVRVIRKAFRNNRRRVKVFSQKNGGKWRALNAAYRLVATDIVVAIDADTVLCKDAVRKLVAPFHDPKVGAVAGNVKVGNRLNILTRLQGLEYITAQNLERRAFNKINGMLVVPGAIGAWRVAAVRAAGGYSGDTLAEDADLTVSVQRQGYKVCFVEDAISITEAPATLVPFLKQRLRWTLGMMQMAWKHRAAISERRVIGLVSLIDLQIFGVLFALFAPLADFVLITTVVVAVSEFLAGRPPLDQNASYILLAGYVILPLMDVLLAVTAVRLDRRNSNSESYAQLWVLPFQRVFYRQLLYLTVYRSVLRALTGRLAKWGSLKRMGTVKLTQWT